MLELNYENTNGAVMIVRAIKNTLRKKMLKLIVEIPGLTVKQIYVRLQIEQSVASKQLFILRQASIVRTVRKGIMVHYFPETDNMRVISALVLQLAPYFKTGKVNQEKMISKGGTRFSAALSVFSNTA